MKKTSLALSCATLVSFFFLTSSYSSAAPITVSGSSPITASASASVTVASACTFSSTVGSEHSATIPAGTYKSEIGATTFNVICNDTEGYSIYAIGYSGSEFGNNKLLANINGTFVSSANINTGTNTSGNPSSWAMKLTPGTGLTASNILNGYGSYSIIPNQYTKVATITSTTTPPAYSTPNSSLEATYAVNIAGAQPAGTYDGKVKYTMVHPANNNIPNEPKDCSRNTICYWPNAEGTVIDSMADQTQNYTNITHITSNMDVTLWASNFKREGYGFAGWSDKHDWELNQNDENGNGTGVNEGYHIYGPNATITLGDVSSKGLSLYAVWVKSQGAIQNWNGCSVMNIGEVTALRDIRDNDTYAVAKLKDGNCWMIENLRLDNTAELTTNNTNNPSLPLTNVYGGATSNYLSVTNDAWCTSQTNDCFRQSMLNTNNTASPVDDMTTPANANIYSCGNYYNWYSATAGSGGGSICPAGWRLPIGAQSTTKGSFGALSVALGGPANSASAVQNSNPTGAVMLNRFSNYPNNFLYSGMFYSARSTGRGLDGYYWSSTTSTGEAYILSLYSTSKWVFPGNSARYTKNWNYGFSVRCLQQ